MEGHQYSHAAVFYSRFQLRTLASRLILLLIHVCVCFNPSFVCPSPAPVPLRGAEEAAGAGHGPDHLTGQQLVSAHTSINTLTPALWFINNQLNWLV